ncbi:MAG: armadillo-type protein [Benniella sp.]|nr:MAG: armadillo-type protein [Benniella sp.]
MLQTLCAWLLTQLESSSSSYDAQMDALDILSEVLLRFGSVSPPPTFKIKRQARCSPSWILNGLETSKNTPDRLRTYIQVTGAISGSNAPHFGMFLSRVAPLVIKYTELDDDELRRNALQALEAFVLRCPTEITPHIDTVIDLGLKFLRHDPNYDDGDDGEDDEDETMESDNEDDEVDDDDGDYSDDDGMSWGVLRTPAKLLSAIIGTRQDLLGQLYTNVAPSLINRF